MPDAADEPPELITTLEVPFSRAFILHASKRYAAAAGLLFIAGAIGGILILRFTGTDLIPLSLIFQLFGYSAAAAYGIVGYSRLRWARHGPDLHLRITSRRIEYVHIGFNLHQRGLTWAEIDEWWMPKFGDGLRLPLIETIKGEYVHINPILYTWSRDGWEANLARAAALEKNIEALFIMYAGERQGEPD